MDTLGTWAEVHDVQGESQRTELAQPEEEKVHCHVQIPNAKVHTRKSQTLLSATVFKDKRQKAQAIILTRYNKKKFRMKCWEHADLKGCRVSILGDTQSWTGPSHEQPALTDVTEQELIPRGPFQPTWLYEPTFFEH